MKLKEMTGIGSAGGYDGFGFIGPLGTKPIKKKIFKFEQADEFLYDEDGKKLSLNELKTFINEDDVKGNKNSLNFEPKCEAFPYCSHGDGDKPLKLIGSIKEEMCDDCYEFCDKIGSATKTNAEVIAEIIRKKYLSI